MEGRIGDTKNDSSRIRELQENSQRCRVQWIHHTKRVASKETPTFSVHRYKLCICDTVHISSLIHCSEKFSGILGCYRYTNGSQCFPRSTDVQPKSLRQPDTYTAILFRSVWGRAADMSRQRACKD